MSNNLASSEKYVPLKWKDDTYAMSRYDIQNPRDLVSYHNIDIILISRPILIAKKLNMSIWWPCINAALPTQHQGMQDILQASLVFLFLLPSVSLLPYKDQTTKFTFLAKYKICTPYLTFLLIFAQSKNLYFRIPLSFFWPFIRQSVSIRFHSLSSCQ